jgi:uncharacterized membrane protein
MQDNSKRWQALDIVKAIGVFCMVISHVVVWWYIPSDYGAEIVSDTFFLFIPYLQVIGLFVIIIPISAGAAFRFFIGNDLGNKLRILKNKKTRAIFKKSIFLVILGFLMNFLAFGHNYVLDWDVLQFIGLSLILMTFMIRFLPISTFWLVGAIVLFSAPILRSYLESWNLNYFIAVLISNYEGDSFWPFFPWFSFIVYGFLIADYFKKSRSLNKIKRDSYIVATISILLLIAAFAKNQLFFQPLVENFWGPYIFQPPTLTVLSHFSIFNLSLIFVSNVPASQKKFSRFSFFNTFSKGILWIYVLHISLGYHLVNFTQKFISDSVIAMFFVIAILIIFSYFIGVAVVLLKSFKNAKKDIRK